MREMLQALELPCSSTRSVDVQIDVADRNQFKLDSTTDESYSAEFDGDVLHVSSSSCLGALRAMQTVKQLSRDGTLPKTFRIKDSPSFAHRGLMIDTGRKYLPIGLIKSTLETMGSVKLNVLHWHIVDSHLFPYEPQFNKDMLNSPDGKYTQNDVKEIINFAMLRGVRVIIEVDSPAHTYSWGKAYPELMTCNKIEDQVHKKCPEPPCGSLNVKDHADEVLATVNLVWDDILAAKYQDDFVHLGGDEIKPDCTPRKAVEKHLSGVAKHVNQKKKTSIIWEDSLDAYIAPSCPSQCVSPYDKDMVVQTWLGPHTSSIIKLGHRVIVTGVTLYLDVGRSTFFADNPSWGGRRRGDRFTNSILTRVFATWISIWFSVPRCVRGEKLLMRLISNHWFGHAQAHSSSMWNRPLQFDSNNMEIETGVWKRMMRHQGSP